MVAPWCPKCGSKVVTLGRPCDAAPKRQKAPVVVQKASYAAATGTLRALNSRFCACLLQQTGDRHGELSEYPPLLIGVTHMNSYKHVTVLGCNCRLSNMSLGTL